MTAKIIDGKKLAEKIRKEIKEKVKKIGIKPGLAFVLVGNNPASQVYVGGKDKACKEAGFYTETFDGSTVAGGIYFVRLQSKEKMQMKRHPGWNAVPSMPSKIEF